MIEADVRRFEELIGYIANGFRLLMVANGAALLACLSALKDYTSVPAYKGIGFLIVLFVVGLVSALFGNMCMLGERLITTRMILSRKVVKAPGWLTTFTTISAFVSLSAFVVSLVLIAAKALWL